MRRLHDLYLYSDATMSEKDFIIRKTEISKKLEEVICCGYAVAWNDVLDLASEEIWDNGMTV